MTILIGIVMIILGALLAAIPNLDSFVLSDFGTCLFGTLEFGGLLLIVLGIKAPNRKIG